MPEHEKALLKPAIENNESINEQKAAPKAIPTHLISAQQPQQPQKPQQIVALQRLIGNQATRKLLKSSPPGVQRQSQGREQEYASEEWIPVENENYAPSPTSAPPPVPPPSRSSTGLNHRIQREGEGAPAPAPAAAGAPDGYLSVIPPSSNSR